MQFWVMLGFTLIIFAWILQLLEVWNKGKNISLWFVFFYSIGVLSLVIDGFMTKNIDVAFLNIITLVFSGIIFGVVLANHKEVSENKFTLKKPVYKKRPLIQK